MAGAASAQITDTTQAPNTANAGAHKSYTEQIGAGRGDVMTPGSSTFIIKRDPFRAIRRGRQIFQRKFQISQGLGPRTGDGVGDIETDGSIGAGVADSCAGCHARPFGSAGFGGNVFTRPDSRDAPHLFGLGLQEMLAAEITAEIRGIRDDAIEEAMDEGEDEEADLWGKGIYYGSITAFPDGSVDTSDVQGVDEDLRVRPFFAQGATISMREFIVGAFNAEMGLESPDADLLDAAVNDLDVVTPAGMSLTGSVDNIEGPPAADELDDPDGDGVVNEIPAAIVDHTEFYLLNYFKPGRGAQDRSTRIGFRLFRAIGCADCHRSDLLVNHDRRVADIDTTFDFDNSNQVFNFLFGRADARFHEVDDGSGFPTLKVPNGDSFLVQGIFTDFKRHDLGVKFHERNFDGTRQRLFITEPLWGVASTPPYGHDGRSGSLNDVILRHGGEAEYARNNYVYLGSFGRSFILRALGSLVLFSPEDTASELNPKDTANPDFPLKGHGSISLTPLFNDTSDIE